MHHGGDSSLTRLFYQWFG